MCAELPYARAVGSPGRFTPLLPATCYLSARTSTNIAVFRILAGSSVIQTVHLRRCLATHICYSNGTLRLFRVVSTCALHSAVPHICVSRLVECVRLPFRGPFLRRLCVRVMYALMSRGRPYSRSCVRCGARTTRHRATCSEACRVAVVHTDSRETRVCPTCGLSFRTYRTSTQVCCSGSCAGLRRRLPCPACAVCGSPTPHRLRKTCSDVCAAELGARAADARRGRSSEKARKRTAAKRIAYRRSDKRMVEACMYQEQDGACAICGCAGTKRGDGTFGLILDHCHRSGRPRALLCGRCNVAVGMVRENVAIARSLAAYVARVCNRG